MCRGKVGKTLIGAPSENDASETRPVSYVRSTIERGEKIAGSAPQDGDRKSSALGVSALNNLRSEHNFESKRQTKVHRIASGYLAYCVLACSSLSIVNFIHLASISGALD